MRSARVVVLSDYIGGDGVGSGGAGHAALDSVAALRAAGVAVRAIAGFGADRVAGVETLGGHDLRAGGARDTLRAIHNSTAAAAVEGALAGLDPATTLLIVHQWTRYLSPAALGVTARFATMIYMHDYFWACPNGVYYDHRLAQPCRRRPMAPACLVADCDHRGRVAKLGRVIRQASRRWVSPDTGARRLFLHLSPGACRTAAPLLPGARHAVLYNPLVVSPPPSDRPAPVHDIGYFGRLEPDKGVGDLIAAARATGRSALFVGEGSLAAQLTAPGIVHVPWQPREMIAAAMRSCATVVLPSRWHETWGLVVAEAMAAGVPVLVSTRAGSAELVRRFGGGALFDPGVEGGLAAALRAPTAAPLTAAGHGDLSAFLSPARHAARIVTLARQHFGLDLLPPSARRSPRPAGSPPPAM